MKMAPWVEVQDEPEIRLVSLPYTDGYIKLTLEEAKALYKSLGIALKRVG